MFELDPLEWQSQCYHGMIHPMSGFRTIKGRRNDFLKSTYTVMPFIFIVGLKEVVYRDHLYAVGKVIWQVTSWKSLPIMYILWRKKNQALKIVEVRNQTWSKWTAGVTIPVIRKSPFICPYVTFLYFPLITLFVPDVR